MLVGGPSSMGPAPAKEGHGAIGHEHPPWEEGGDKPRGERERKWKRPTEQRRRGAPETVARA